MIEVDQTYTIQDVVPDCRGDNVGVYYLRLINVEKFNYFDSICPLYFKYVNIN